MTELERIKTELFKMKLSNQRLAGRAVIECGFDDDTTKYFRTRDDVLLDLLENSGLTEEYQAWAKEQPDEDEGDE